MDSFLASSILLVDLEATFTRSRDEEHLGGQSRIVCLIFAVVDDDAVGLGFGKYKGGHGCLEPTKYGLGLGCNVFAGC